MKINIYNKEGEIISEKELNPEIFGIEPNLGLMHRYLVYQRSNSRYNLAKTKTKADVRGGGRKPYKQKGTGRARQGSTRNPHFIGGGVSHGPVGNRNFSLMMPKKMRRLALFSFLSQKAKENSLIGVDDYFGIKTKDFIKFYSSLPTTKNTLFVISSKNQELSLSSRNFDNAKVLLVNYLNPIDLTNYNTICFIGDSMDKIEQVFIGKKLI